MSRLKDKYLKEVLPKIKEEFNIKNTLAVPKLEKIVLNIGAGDIRGNQAGLEKLVSNLSALSGQKPALTKAKKSIATFKLSQGEVIGVMATLRGERMYDFFDKLVNIVLPKVRDFRGVSEESFDGQGNFSLGLSEQTVFPEVSFQSSGEKSRGLQVSIVTSAHNKEKGRRLLELLGMPFRKG